MHSLQELFHRKKVIVIGDTILDQYTYGTVIGTSAETPTLVAKETKMTHNLGGAFLVARNLLSLGVHVSFFTLVGSDSDADFIKNFHHPKLSLFTYSDEGRLTTVKKRYWVDGYKLLQFDKLDNRPLHSALE